MYQRREAKRWQQQHFATLAIDIAPVDLAPDVNRDRVLGPFPLFQRLRIELELARRSGKAGAGAAVDFDADRGPTACDDSARRIDRRVLKIVLGTLLFVNP